VKEFVEGCYKGVQTEVVLEEEVGQEFGQLAELVGKVWKGMEVIPADLANFTKLCES
jgi:hypothetical protein